MIKIDYTQKIDLKGNDFSGKEIPSFASYAPNIEEIKSFGKELLKYQNIIIIGRGGSVTSFRAYFDALVRFSTNKKVYIVDTADPDYLNYVKKNCPTSKTVIIVISKSGKTIDVIENYLYFSNYKNVFITTLDGNPLHEIAKSKNIKVLEHPEIGGRYSGLTATALLPAFLVGINIDNLWRGAKKAYAEFGSAKKGNQAAFLASYLYNFDQKGFVDIYLPIYSERLGGFSELIMQLIHESVGKGGRGPTILPVSAPESQHHTNQRYFGGRKNIQGLFLRVENFESDIKLVVDNQLSGLEIRSGELGAVNGLPISKTMRAEFIGTFEDSKKRGVPAAAITVEKINEESVGYFTGLLHFLTVYLSWLNNVDPFDQPEVESSKEISFKERFRK